MSDEKEEVPWIPIEECKKGHVYYIDSRNLGFGIFDGTNKNGFIGIRSKFSSLYLFTEYHWDNGPPFGTVKPYMDLGHIPEGIPVRESWPNAWEPLTENGKSTGEWREILRRDLKEGEEPHGGRKGFVDEWKDTGERTPDKVYGYHRENKEMFDHLRHYEVPEEHKEALEALKRKLWPWIYEEEN
jgi:hypothetical protein